ncbi:hypothetical protein TomMM35A_04870 [Sphingobium sp. TomMM35A]
MAPAGETAEGLQRLSWSMTAQIQRSGKAERVAASATWVRKRDRLALSRHGGSVALEGDDCGRRMSKVATARAPVRCSLMTWLGSMLQRRSCSAK